MEISPLCRMGILNRKTYVKFLALCPLNGWASTFILIAGSGHTVVHTSFKDAFPSQCIPLSLFIRLNDVCPAAAHSQAQCLEPSLPIRVIGSREDT